MNTNNDQDVYEERLAHGLCENCASGDGECLSQSCEQRREWDRELLAYDRADMD